MLSGCKMGRDCKRRAIRGDAAKFGDAGNVSRPSPQLAPADYADAGDIRRHRRRLPEPPTLHLEELHTGWIVRPQLRHSHRISRNRTTRSLLLQYIPTKAGAREIDYFYPSDTLFVSIPRRSGW